MSHYHFIAYACTLLLSSVDICFLKFWTIDMKKSFSSSFYRTKRNFKTMCSNFLLLAMPCSAWGREQKICSIKAGLATSANIARTTSMIWKAQPYYIKFRQCEVNHSPYSSCGTVVVERGKYRAARALFLVSRFLRVIGMGHYTHALCEPYKMR